MKQQESTSAQHQWELLQNCWKNIPGGCIKLDVSRMPRLCKAGTKTEELLQSSENIRLYYLISWSQQNFNVHFNYFIVLMSIILQQNYNNKEQVLLQLESSHGDKDMLSCVLAVCSGPMFSQTSTHESCLQLLRAESTAR